MVLEQLIRIFILHSCRIDQGGNHKKSQLIRFLWPWLLLLQQNYAQDIFQSHLRKTFLGQAVKGCQADINRFFCLPPNFWVQGHIVQHRSRKGFDESNCVLGDFISKLNLLLCVCSINTLLHYTTTMLMTCNFNTLPYHGIINELIILWFPCK